VRRRKGAKTTVPAAERRPRPDLVERDFTAQAPDQLDVADITYTPTWTGFLYLAGVMDVYSRRIVGWRMATHLRTELVRDALDVALGQRRPVGVIHHSDEGCEYMSIGFGRCCRHAGVRPSMGSVGDCYDNAMAESFFATLARRPNPNMNPSTEAGQVQALPRSCCRLAGSCAAASCCLI
jgi:putative transposase